MRQKEQKMRQKRSKKCVKKGAKNGAALEPILPSCRDISVSNRTIRKSCMRDIANKIER